MAVTSRMTARARSTSEEVGRLTRAIINYVLFTAVNMGIFGRNLQYYLSVRGNSLVLGPSVRESFFPG